MILLKKLYQVYPQLQSQLFLCWWKTYL